MKISTKSIYGLEALVDLAIHSAEGPVSLKSISERCELSEMYILQIFLVLRRNGIVTSVRGAQGGYKFAKDIKIITVAEILIALEGSLALVDCVTKRTEESCDHYENCTTRFLWEKIENEFYNITKAVTIYDIAECCKSQNDQTGDIEYYL